MSEAVALREADALPVWNPRQTLAYADLVHAVMREVLKDGVHYGIIPGTDKKSLFKPGAEKIGVTFRLAAEFIITETDMGSGHLDVKTRTILRSIETGKVVGDGIGSCSTMESKYRWRQAERVCPSCGKATIIKGKAEYGGGWLCFKKKGGCGEKYIDGDKAIEGQQVGRVENSDIADTYNTVRKMSKKRSHVDAIITATGASDIFTQDVEDEDETDRLKNAKDVTPPKTAKPESPAAPPGPAAEDGGKESPPPPAGDENPAVEDWKRELREAESIEKLAALWKSLQKKEVWPNFQPTEQGAMEATKDKRKGELQKAASVEQGKLL